MAIYCCSLRTFSRARGDSAVAAAAYRAGSRLKDERTGRMHRYEKRKGVISAFILAPHGVPEKFLTRTFLWNAAEAAEVRKNARVARELILALPHELSAKERVALAYLMALYLMERYGVIVDVAIHAPVVGDGHDERNHHAHLLFTTREVSEDGFGKKTRILDDKVLGPAEIEMIRAVWETLANDALSRAGFADIRIDRRTLEAQGIDRIPQIHEGKAARNARIREKRSALAEAFRESGQEGFGKDESGDEEGDGSQGSASGSSSGESGSGGASDSSGGSSESSSGSSESGSASGSSGSGSGSGATALTLASKVRVIRERSIDYPSFDRHTRSGFNAEIRALNERRAAFGDKPLVEQIAQLDRLMERLDRRLDNLQTLKTRTSLPAIIKNAITGAAKMAAGFLMSRRETAAALELTATEKQARRERQLARYGRSYREGLHNRMNEMQQNMQIVQQKKDDFRRYKSFVDKINAEVKKHSPSITTTLERADQPKRQITQKELGLKLYLKAEMMRTNIPEAFKPPAVKADRKTLVTSTAINKIMQSTNAPIRVERTPAPKIEIAPPEDPKSWLIRDARKMATLIQTINQKLDDIYAKEPFAPNRIPASTGSMKDQFDKAPAKRTTTAECLARIRAKGEMLRENVAARYQGHSSKDTSEHSFMDYSAKPKKPSLSHQFNGTARTKRKSNMDFDLKPV